MTALVPTPVMDAYRRQQATLGGKVAISAAHIVSKGLNVSNPDQGWPSLLAELLALLRGGRSVSEDLAMAFYRHLRDVEDAAGDGPDQPDVPFPTGQVVGSLWYTGPRMAQSLLKRNPRADPRDIATRVGVMVGRSAMRHTLNGGRETLRVAAVEDPAAWGWARITDGDPCKFCAMLAGRGPVYKTAHTAGDATNRYHDGCACSVVAVFKGPPAKPKRTAEARHASRRGEDGLTDRQRRVIEGVRRDVESQAVATPARDAVEAVEPVEPVRRGDPLNGVDLKNLSYEEIGHLYEQYAEDEIAGAALLAEVDRRDLVDRAAKAAAERNEFTTDDADGWLAQGEALDEILDNNGWGNDGAPEAWRDEINPSRGKTASEQSRDLYEEWVYTQYLQAEGDTRGVLLNRAGVAAGVDPASLFSGPAARARKYASEELLRWWGDHQRLTLTEFRAQHLGRASDKRAAKRTREGSSGREFGV